MPRRKKQSSEAAVRDIRRKTRRRFSAEEKIRIVLDGMRGELSVAELCRREGIAANLYYRWSKRDPTVVGGLGCCSERAQC
jgi:transposase